MKKIISGAVKAAAFGLATGVGLSIGKKFIDYVIEYKEAENQYEDGYCGDCSEGECCGACGFGKFSPEKNDEVAAGFDTFDTLDATYPLGISSKEFNDKYGSASDINLEYFEAHAAIPRHSCFAVRAFVDPLFRSNNIFYKCDKCALKDHCTMYLSRNHTYVDKKNKVMKIF